jgi:hypothetical protein
MNEPLEALVDALAGIALEEHLDDPDALAGALAERQRLLSAIEEADREALSPELRADLKERLQALLRRDAELLDALHELHEETRKGLEQLASGRAAVRGYGASPNSEPPAMRRIG